MQTIVSCRQASTTTAKTQTISSDCVLQETGVSDVAGITQPHAHTHLAIQKTDQL